MVHYYKKGHLQQIVGSLLLKAEKITTDLQLQKKTWGVASHRRLICALCLDR